MKAIILAAGKSTRLYPISLEQPKCLMEVNGKRIIDRQIEALRMIGIDDIVVVVGYKGEVIKKELQGKVRYWHYYDYEKTNNFHTLWSVRDSLHDDFICLFSDVLFDVEIIKMTRESTADFCMVIDTSKVLNDTMGVKMENGRLANIGTHIPENETSGNFIGIAKFSKIGSKILLTKMETMASGHKNDFYTIAIDALLGQGVKIDYIDVRGKVWININTKEDFDSARQYAVKNVL